MNTSCFRLGPTIVSLLFLGVLTLTAQQPRRPQAAGQPRDPRAGQPAAVGSGSITGTVLVAGTGQPARKARVNLSGAELRGNRTTTTDDYGRFSFTALPAGRFTLTATKPGHVTAAYGQRRPGAQGTPIQLADGQKFDAQLQISRGGVLTGAVLDEHGEPTPGTPVRALLYVVRNGERTTQAAGNATTDDRGMYRIYGLQPGTYMVCATPRNVGAPLDQWRSEMQGLTQSLQSLAGAGATGEQMRGLQERLAAVQARIAQPGDEGAAGYAPVCYPGTTSAVEAQPIPLGIAEERIGINFQLQLVPMARIEGTVVNSTNVETRNVQLVLQSPTQVGLPVTHSARADGEGRFSFAGVPPGQYRLTARAPIVDGDGRGRGGVQQMPGRGGRGAARGGQGVLWAAADLIVDGTHVSNVMLSLAHGMTVAGQVRFEGTRPQPEDLTRLRVSLAPAERSPLGSAGAAALDASGNFRIDDVAPGRYRINVAGGQGWFAGSAMVGGQDALDFPFEVKPGQGIGGITVTMIDRQSELSGVLVDATNQPATAFTLVIYPVDEAYWSSPRRIRLTRPGTDGRYIVSNLPAGEYRIATVVDVDASMANDPAYLQQLDPVSMRISIEPGERKVQDIRVGQ